MKLSKKIYSLKEIPIGRCFIVESDDNMIFKKISIYGVWSFYHEVGRTIEKEDYEQIKDWRALQLILPEKKIKSRFEILDIRKE